VKSPAARAASFQVGQRLRELEILTIQCRLLTRILLSTGQGVQMLVGRARDYRVCRTFTSLRRRRVPWPTMLVFS
jgi:hypothetical protein